MWLLKPQTAPSSGPCLQLEGFMCSVPAELKCWKPKPPLKPLEHPMLTPSGRSTEPKPLPGNQHWRIPPPTLCPEPNAFASRSPCPSPPWPRRRDGDPHLFRSLRGLYRTLSLTYEMVLLACPVCVYFHIQITVKSLDISLPCLLSDSHKDRSLGVAEYER
jgi:hypothetical protein